MKERLSTSKLVQLLTTITAQITTWLLWCYHCLDTLTEVIQVHTLSKYCQINHNKKHYLLFWKYRQLNYMLHRRDLCLCMVVSLPYTNTNEGFTYRKYLYSMQENWWKNQLTAICNLLHTFQYSNQIVHSWGRWHSSWQRENLEHINHLGLIWFWLRRHP